MPRKTSHQTRYQATVPARVPPHIGVKCLKSLHCAGVAS